MEKKQIPGFTATLSLTPRSNYKLAERFTKNNDRISPQAWSGWQCAVMAGICIAAVVDPLPGDEALCAIWISQCAVS